MKDLPFTTAELPRCGFKRGHLEMWQRNLFF